MTLLPHLGPMNGLRPLLALWKADHGELFGFELEEDVFVEHLEEFRDAGGVVLTLVAADARIVGMMGLCIHPSPFSGQLCLEEHMWYIQREYRSLEMSRLFLAWAEAWGMKRGAQVFLLTSSLMANKNAGRVARLYERWGFVPFEATYIREIKTLGVNNDGLLQHTERSETESSRASDE